MRRTPPTSLLAPLALALLLVVCAGIDRAAARTFRWASDADVAALDPYARQERFLLAFLANVYEPLVRRGPDLAIEPGLATHWSQVAPLVWRFKLRDDVRFAGGEPFGADDVVFSYVRATAPTSKLAVSLSAIREVRRVDDHTIDIVTVAPDPILPAEITHWAIMSKAWCEAHDAAAPTDLVKDDENYAASHADGTGPFMVVERVAGDHTVLAPNPGWWDRPEHNLDRVEFRPIPNDSARVAALSSGAVDMIYSVPRQDIDRIARSPGLRIVHTPELRTIFLGFDQSSRELPGSGIRGRNPFKDRRVREAFSRAIDEAGIVAKVMRGLATPAALLVGPGVNGFDAALDERPAYDPAAAQRLLDEAGYARGFSLDMDCPNDRYINDETICQAVAADLAKIGIRVKLTAQTRALFFGKIFDPGYGSSFYLMGFTPANADAASALINLAASRSDALHTGEFNIGGYANRDLDALIQRAQLEANPAARTGLLRRALDMVKDDYAYIPLHQQGVVWAVRDGVELVQRGDDSFPLRYVRMK